MEKGFSKNLSPIFLLQAYKKLLRFLALIALQCRLGGLLDEQVVALEGGLRLVDKLVVAALVHRGAMQSKEVSHETESCIYCHAIL